ncbi:hypothetical protein [Neobacillus sp. NPDC093127]|uniref:hypothetical protein n=1 Tax=Neobacillus sp. NPDC093127 TaxID=3364296 RepID=UPI0038014D16
MNYLTEEDYRKAESNGISRKLAYQRFYTNGWKVEDAVTKPVTSYKKLFSKYKDPCKKAGISMATFYRRIKKGMRPDEAVAFPSALPGKYERKAKITENDYLIAEGNGIKRGTVQGRVYQYHWPVDLAVTVPVGGRLVGGNT